MLNDLTETTAELRAQSPVLSRTLTAAELTGLAQAEALVPPGMVGVHFTARGAERLPAGQHRVRWWWENHQPQVVLFAEGDFALACLVPELLAGGPQGDLVDADLRLHVALTDPVRFYTRLGQTRPEWRVFDLARAVQPLARAVLAPLVRAYLPTDLTHARATPALLPTLHADLTARLDELGLTVRDLPAPRFALSSDAAAQARKALELRQKMRQVADDEHMDDLQRQAELADFARQMAALNTPELADTVPANPAPTVVAQAVARLNHWLDEAEPTDSTRLNPAMPTPAPPADTYSGIPSGAPTLDTLRHTDQHTRQQVFAALHRAISQTQQARLTAHRANQPDLVMRLHALEKALARLATDLPNGQPAYLTQPALTLADLYPALQHEAGVVRQAVALAECTLTGQWDSADQRLLALQNQWAQRATLFMDPAA